MKINKSLTFDVWSDVELWTVKSVYFLDVCEGYPCYNSGTCVRLSTGPHCDCPEGYGGDVCDIGNLVVLIIIP